MLRLEAKIQRVEVVHSWPQPDRPGSTALADLAALRLPVWYPRNATRPGSQ